MWKRLGSPRAQLLHACASAAGLHPPLPMWPMLQLRDDVQRFVSSFGAVPRLLQLLAQLRWAGARAGGWWQGWAAQVARLGACLHPITDPCLAHAPLAAAAKRAARPPPAPRRWRCGSRTRRRGRSGWVGSTRCIATWCR